MKSDLWHRLIRIETKNGPPDTDNIKSIQGMHMNSGFDFESDISNVRCNFLIYSQM